MNTKSVLWCCVLLVILSIQACGSAGVGSCHLVSVGYCEHYTGSGYSSTPTLVTTLQSVCQTAKGTWSNGPCPTADNTGSCVMAKATFNEIIVTYYQPRFADTNAAQQACTSGIGGNAPGGGEFRAP